MTQALSALSPGLRARLASALDVGLLVAPYSAARIRAVVGSEGGIETPDDVAAALTQLGQLGVTARGAAAWLRALEAGDSARRLPELVWSGPEIPGVPTRKTPHVFNELIGSARRSILLSTYVYFDGPRAFGQLAARMDEVPTLTVTMLLNIQRSWGDTTSADELIRGCADRLWGGDWPGARRPAVFYDTHSLDEGGPGGVLHAKALVADGESVLVTSANMTEAAMDRNIEVGLLVRDRALAASMTAHFQELIHSGRLAPLPGA